ncbi:MAG: hypothetical protein WC833_05030 [Bacteroidales bacterium]|jgi:hypothetical protein
MKNLFALLVLSVMFSFQMHSQETHNALRPADIFFHDVQFGITLASTEIGTIPFLELSTCHGINFGKRFSAGVGISTLYFMTLAPYVQTRMNFGDPDRSRRTISYVSLQAGYLVYLDSSIRNENSIIIQPSLGYSFVSKSGKTSWTVFIAAFYIGDRIFPKTGVGFEF